VVNWLGASGPGRSKWCHVLRLFKRHLVAAAHLIPKSFSGGSWLYFWCKRTENINSISTCTFVWLITRLTAKTLVKRSVRSATENIRYISTSYPPPAIRHPRMQILW